MDQLLKLEPHVVYELVYNLFAGREIKMIYSSNKTVGEGQSELELEKYSKKDLSRIQLSITNQLESDEDEENISDDNSGYSRGYTCVKVAVALILNKKIVPSRNLRRLEMFLKRYPWIKF